MRQKVISQLISEINDLRLTVTYCQSRILRKQIALQEILDGTEPESVAELPVSIALVPSNDEAHPVAPREKQISVAKMVQAVLPEINGNVFYYADVRLKIKEKFPDSDDKKVYRGVFPACDWLLTKKRIIRVPGGFQQTQLHAETKSMPI